MADLPLQEGLPRAEVGETLEVEVEAEVEEVEAEEEQAQEEEEAPSYWEQNLETSPEIA